MIIKRKNILFLVISMFFIFIFASCGRNIQNNTAKDDVIQNADINKDEVYNVIKKAFITQNGYSNEVSKHMSKKVFEKINIYKIYSVNDPKYKKPFKVDFSLKQNSQESINNVVYVNMIYSVSIKDSQNKNIGASKDIPIKFTIKKINNTWYITDKKEPA